MDNRTRIYKSCRAALPGVTVVTKHAVGTQPVIEVRHHHAKTLSALATVHLVRLPTLATRATITTRLNPSHDAFPLPRSFACRSQWPGSIDTHTWRAPSVRLGMIRDCTRNGFFFAPINAL